MPDETPTGNGATPAQPANPVVPPVQPPAQPPAAPATDPETGKLWSERFHGAHGALKQAQREKAELEGSLNHKIESLTSEVRSRDATIAQLRSQIEKLEQSTEVIPTLNNQIDTLTQQAAKAERYQLLMDYPELLGLKVEQEGEDGEKSVVNPVLQLVETSSMPTDQLKTTLSQFVKTIPAQSQTPSVSDGAVPSTPQSDQPKSSEAWDRTRKAQERLNSGDTSPDAWEEFRTAWDLFNQAGAEN